MFEWSEEQVMIRDVVRRFVDTEIRPHVDELEHGDTPPYDVLRKLFATFGMDVAARARFERQIEKLKAEVGGAVEVGPPPAADADEEEQSAGGGAAMLLIPIIELCRVCPGMVTAMGVSMGLTAA